MIHSHRLTSKNKRHKSFLEEERKDPITGDKLIEGNEIVLCGACKSAFLLDSWNYMARSHCNQPFTLKEIPTKQHVVRELEVEVEKEYKFILNDENDFLKFVLTIPIIFLGPVLLNSVIEPNFIVKSPFIFSIAIIFVFLSFYLFLRKSNVKISKTKSVLFLPFRTKTFYLSRLERLDFYNSLNDNNIFFLVFFLENGSAKKVRIIKDKDTISTIKELQKYFEENNLSDKISVFIDNLT